MLRALLALACAFTIKFAIGHFSSPSLDYTLAATDAIPAAALLLTVSVTSLITCVPSTAVSLISLKLLLTSKAVYSNLFTIDPKKVGLLVFVRNCLTCFPLLLMVPPEGLEPSIP